MYTNTRAMLVQQQEAMLQTKTQSVISQFDALFKEKGALVKQMSTNDIFRKYIETTSSSEDVLTSTHAAQTQATLAAIVKEEPSRMHGSLAFTARASGCKMMERRPMLNSMCRIVLIISLPWKRTGYISRSLMLTSTMAPC